MVDKNKIQPKDIYDCNRIDCVDCLFYQFTSECDCNGCPFRMWLEKYHK